MDGYIAKPLRSNDFYAVIEGPLSAPPTTELKAGKA